MNYYVEIRNTLINNEINKRVKDYSKNKVELESYYNVGKLLSEAGKHYGEGIIKKYSEMLTKELGKKYSDTSLKYMRQFYIFSKSQSVIDSLSWTHYTVLLPIKDINKINYYIKITEEQNLSVRELRKRIKEKEYERLPETTKIKLIESKELEIEDEIKNPIIIKNKNNIDVDNIKERILQKQILEDLNSFLNQLGKGYCYIQNEYKIKIGENRTI